MTPPTTQRKNNKKKKREPSTLVTPVVPQPQGTTAPGKAIAPPPGKKWILVEEDATRPASPEVSIVEPEPVKVDARLQQAQADVDKMQSIIESALICLLEPRQNYQLSKAGIQPS